MAMIGNTRGVDRGLIVDLPPAQPAKPKVNWAGVLADALSGLAGQGPIYAPIAERRRQEEAARVDWGLKRQAELEDRMKVLDWQRNNPEPSAMERNLSTWQTWTPEQRQAYQSMQEANGNDFVTTTLPNGQFYAGPKSGIAAALSGFAPQRPQVGAVVPDPRKAGGPTAIPSAGFPRPY